PVVAQLAIAGQALVDHRAEARGDAPPLAGRGAEALVAGALVGVLDRLLEQGVARGEVVVDEPGGDARLGRDPRDAQVVDAVARDQRHRRVEQPLASLWSLVLDSAESR